MSQHRTRVLLFAFVLLSITAARSAAGEFVATTALNPLNGNSFNQGWWSPTTWQDVGSHNYFTGYDATNGQHARSYLSFDLTNVSAPVTTATLKIEDPWTVTPDAFETVGFFAVTTPASSLNTRHTINQAIYDDLGDGPLLAQANSSPTNGPGVFLEVTLNQTGIDAINAARGNFFSVGMTLLTLSGAGVNEGVFGNSESYPNELRIVFVPEPSAQLLMLAAVLAAGWAPGGLRRRGGPIAPRFVPQAQRADS